MLILVEGHQIETKDIWDIVEAPYGYHGFTIKMAGPVNIFIGKKQSYDSNNYELSAINDTYRKLRESVKAKWEEDKTNLPIFKL